MKDSLMKVYITIPLIRLLLLPMPMPISINMQKCPGQVNGPIGKICSSEKEAIGTMRCLFQEAAIK
jgi:hypothetical protein